MEIKASNSFFKSLNRLSWQTGPIYRTYDTIVNELPEFFKNVWRFRRELWSHRWWDHSFTLQMIKRSVEIQANGMEAKGCEVRESSDKKIIKMRRLCQIIDNILDDKYIPMAEQIHGQINYKPLRFIQAENEDFYMLADDDTEEEKDHQRKVYKEAHALEQKEWEEFCEIIKGKKYKEYKDWDGSDLRSWWD
jgi:hypothetical protein